MFRARLLARFSSDCSAARPFGLLLGTLLAFVSTFLACDSTTDDGTVQPITGVTVQSASLIAGRGCGTGASQIFKYAVVVNGVDKDSAADLNIPLSQKTYNVFQAANIYDCFSDGTFTNLQASNGISSYHLEVYAFSQSAYVAAGGNALGVLMLDLQKQKAAQDLQGTGGPNSVAIENDLATLRGKPATYSTTCTAEQLGLVQTLAVCKPLVNGPGTDGGSAPATITLPLGSFTSADSGTVTCSKDYATVRVTATIDGTAGPAIATTECTASPLTITMASTPASYSLAVTLVKADDTTLGTTTCATDTSFGLTLTPTCQPLQ